LAVQRPFVVRLKLLADILDSILVLPSVIVVWCALETRYLPPLLAGARPHVPLGR
jgi:hypothetical protein